MPTAPVRLTRTWAVALLSLIALVLAPGGLAETPVDDVAQSRVTFNFEGHIGCAVGFRDLASTDQCEEGGSDLYEIPLQIGLTAAVLDLEWDSEEPLHLDRLNVRTHTFFFQFEVEERQPGHVRLVLAEPEEGYHTTHASSFHVDVRAAPGDPALVVDEDYTVVLTLAYGGADLDL